MNGIVQKTATLNFNGTTVEIPIIERKEGHIIQVSSLLKGFIPAETDQRNFYVTTAISNVDGINGKLNYRGYDINDLVHKTSYEETSFLLLRGDLPNKAELKDFNQNLAGKAVIDPELQKELIDVAKAIRINEKSNPMSIMSSLVAVMDNHEQLSVKTQIDRYDSALRTVALMPTLIGVVNARMQAENSPEKLDQYQFAKAEDFGKEGEKFSYAALLTSQLSQQPINTLDQGKVDAMNKYLILHAEHSLNVSADTARVVDSAESKAGAWRNTLGAMQSLAGNRHGNASNDALDNLKKILARPETTIEEKVDAYIKQSDADRAARKAGGTTYKGPDGMIEGIGHAIYQAKDPRASSLQNILRSIDGNSALLKVALTLEDRLKTHPDFGGKEKKPLHPNVDFCAGVLLTEHLGIPSNLMTSMFAVARNVGWHAHAAEQARDTGKLVRPQAIALTDERAFIEMENRTPPTQVNGATIQLKFPDKNVLENSKPAIAV